MPKQPRILEGSEHRAVWSGEDRSVRRRVMRAVNRARALEDPYEAGLAVGIARTQQRFWKRGWVIAPLIAAALQYPAGIEAVMANAAVATVIFGVAAWLFIRRARFAEARNRAVVEEAVAKAARAAASQQRRPPRPRRGKRKRKRKR